MNAQRRKTIDELIAKLNDIDIQSVLDEDQDYYDNMPEGLQSGEKGEKAQEAITELENAVQFIEDAVSALEAAKE